MAHAWKACWVQALGGSNPPFSAISFLRLPSRDPSDSAELRHARVHLVVAAWVLGDPWAAVAEPTSRTRSSRRTTATRLGCHHRPGRGEIAKPAARCSIKSESGLRHLAAAGSPMHSVSDPRSLQSHRLPATTDASTCKDEGRPIGRPSSSGCREVMQVTSHAAAASKQRPSPPQLHRQRQAHKSQQSTHSCRCTTEPSHQTTPPRATRTLLR